MPIRPRSVHRPVRSVFFRSWSMAVYATVAALMSIGGVCLWKSGRWLVAEDPFTKVTWAVVLAGESRDCERSDAAIKLWLAGRADSLIISACRIFKTRYASEFMIDYYAREGVPRDRVFEFRQDTYSTQEEARALIRQFRLMNLDTVVIVTANYHTARTRRIFRKLSQGFPHVLVHSAPYDLYDPQAWWSSRESRKTWLQEWIKTVATWMELSGAKPEDGKAEFQGLVPDIWTIPGSAPAGGGKPDSVVRGDSANSAAAPGDSAAADSAGAKAGAADTLKAAAAGDSSKAVVPVDSSGDKAAGKVEKPSQDAKTGPDAMGSGKSGEDGAGKADKAKTAPVKPSVKPAKDTAKKVPEKAVDKTADKDKAKKKPK